MLLFTPFKFWLTIIVMIQSFYHNKESNRNGRVIDYRADDSYFSFAEAFVQNGLSLRSLNQALRTFPEKSFSPERSPVYWAGWALAEYQWSTGKRFKDIFSRISLSEIISMYSVYHEMDIEHFIEDMNIKYHLINRETRLKYIRENRGLSQAELSELSGVKLRSVQIYEQKVNSIDKAQARTVYKLSRVLGCTVEDLLESPEM